MKQSYLAICASLVCCLAPLCVQAAEERAINVVGTGEVQARPTSLEMNLRASAAAELTGDAVVKYQASLRRLRGAIAKLQMKNLTIDERSLQIGDASPETDGDMVFSPQPQPVAAKSSVQISRSLRVTVRGIDKMSEAEVIDAIGKLLDTAKDAGAAMGGAGAANNNVYQAPAVYGRAAGAAIQFVIEHPEELREQAYRKAFDDAKSKGTRLAKLAGKQLGDALTIEEDAAMHWVAYGNRVETDDASRLASDELKEIPVRILLRVRFELLDAPAKATRASNQ